MAEQEDVAQQLPAESHLLVVLVQDAPAGLFHRSQKDAHYLSTRFEAGDAQLMVPCFDQPEHKVPWSVSVRVPDGVAAYANAPLKQQVDDGGHEVSVFEQIAPLPSDLLAIAVAPDRPYL